MKRFLSVVVFLAVVAGTLVAWQRLVLADPGCGSTCPPVAVCDYDDVSGNCKGCVSGFFGALEATPCDNKDDVFWNPMTVIYHGSSLGGTKDWNPNTLICSTIIPCGGKDWHHQTPCVSHLIFWLWCDGYDSRVNCANCKSFPDDTYDTDYIECACFDCPIES